jgi:hypothetical protein
MKVFIKPYKAGSKSVKALVDGLKDFGIDAKVIKFTDSKYVHDPENHLVINWGCSAEDGYENILNESRAVCVASDKVSTFMALAEHDVRSVPVFYTKEDAAKFLKAKKGRSIYCRTILRGSQGKGIVVANDVEELVDAKLYTGGLRLAGRKEFRVHIFKDMVLHTQEKRRRNGYRDDVNYNSAIRNLAGGWIFGIKDVNIPYEIKHTCVEAVRALGLDFGAVDILQTPNGKGWVLEVNTACGLEGTTVDRYVHAIAEYVRADEWEKVRDKGLIQPAAGVVAQPHGIPIPPIPVPVEMPPIRIDYFKAEEL